MESRRAPECGSQFRRAARRVQRMHSAADRVLLRARTERRAEIGLRVRAGPRGRIAERGIAARDHQRPAGFPAGRRRPERGASGEVPRTAAAARAAGHEIRGKCAGLGRRVHPPRDRGSGTGGTAAQHRGARPRRCARGGPVRLAVQARPAHLPVGHDLRRGCAAAPRHLRRLGHARLAGGARRGGPGQLSADRGNPAAAPRAGAPAGFRQFRRAGARDAHGEGRRPGAEVPRRARRTLPSCRRT